MNIDFSKYGITYDLYEKYSGEAISAEKEIFEKVNEALENPTLSSRRWFWELLQNAIDTIDSNSKVDVVVKLYNSEYGMLLSFEHNGGAFRRTKEFGKFDDFKNLINPVSGKSIEDSSTVGKFGTGFLSTHILSLQLHVEGLSYEEGKKYRVYSNIDRCNFIDNSREAQNFRIASIIKSLDEYKSNYALTNENIPNAKFIYYLENSPSKLKDSSFPTKSVFSIGYEEIERSVQFVFAFTNKVNSIRIENNVDSRITRYHDSSYTIKDEEIVEWTLKKNNIDLLTKVITSAEGAVTVAWRIDEHKKAIDLQDQYYNSIFCTFPLLNKDSIQFPFIVNSNDFIPNEKREGINLDKEQNQELVNNSFIAYQKLVEFFEDGYRDLYNIFKFDPSVNNFSKNVIWSNSISSKFQNVLLYSRIVQTSDEVKEPILTKENKENVVFPILDLNEENDNKEFYDLCKIIYDKVPIWEHLPNWNKIIRNNKKVTRISIEQLIDRVTEIGFNGLVDRDLLLKTIDADSNLDIYDSIFLRRLYRLVIVKLKKPELLSRKLNNNTSTGIILTRGGKLKRLVNCYKDIGYNGKIINEDFLKIYGKLKNPNLTDLLIDFKFKDLYREEQAQKTEKELSVIIKDEAEKLMKTHDEILKLKNSNKSYNLTRKNSIESNLRELQLWISRYESVRKYFDPYFKRKILQCVIDEVKSKDIMKLMQLDADGTVSLSDQSRIMSDTNFKTKYELGNAIFNAQAEKLEKDKKNKEIGDKIEDLLKEVLEDNGLNPDKEDGEQDFILNKNSSNQIFIEVKSVSVDAPGALITPEQNQKALFNLDNYYFCFIEIDRPLDHIDKPYFLDKARLVLANRINLQRKLYEVQKFQTSDNGISGVLPSPIIMSMIKEKPYKIRIEKSEWGNMTISMFIESLN